MSENTQHPLTEVTPGAPSLSSGPAGCRRIDEPATSNNIDPDAGNEDPREALLRDIEKTRIPAEFKEQILAALPSPEERERLLRELQENGGLTFEEFFGPLLSEFEQSP